MKHIVKLLMVTFLLSSVGLVYAQGPVDKTKDETVKAKTVNTKDTKGSSAGRLGDDENAPTKDAGNDEVVKEKSFFGKLFGGKSAPGGQSSKSAASSRGGSAKDAAPGATASDKPTSSAGKGDGKPSGEKEVEEGQGEDKDDRDGGR